MSYTCKSTFQSIVPRLMTLYDVYVHKLLYNLKRNRHKTESSHATIHENRV